MKRILLCPLSWGLGHATRTMVVARYLARRGHRVTIGAEGRALRICAAEAPECECIEFRDYRMPNISAPFLLTKLILNYSQIHAGITGETRRLRRLLERRPFDMVIGDNRYGIYHPEVPSFIIYHQLCFMASAGLRRSSLGFLMFTLELWNERILAPFDRVIVPDYADPEECLSGRMSHNLLRIKPEQVYYAGILSGVEKMPVPEDLDVFISVSGPEPQRVDFERVVMDHIHELDGQRVVVTLGKPEERRSWRIGKNITVHTYLTRRQQAEMMNRARMIVCRSGYTTLMELAEIRKKALLIPTPGQSEQEVLAAIHYNRERFHGISQYELDLKRDLEKARKRPGFTFGTPTEENLERLYEDVFAPILDG